MSGKVRRAGGMDVALTYVTGTLVRLRRGTWEETAPIAALRTSFAVGAAAGGLAATADATTAITGASLFAAALAAFSTLRSPLASPAVSRSAS